MFQGAESAVARRDTTDGMLATLTVLDAVYLIWLGLNYLIWLGLNTVTRPATPEAAAGAAPQS